MIKENYLDVQKKVFAACERAGRKPEDVTLIAVSKTKPVSMIEELLPLGVVNFGENKPQELKEKYEVLPKDLKWHMIGHLQRNKVKYIIDKACMIHSLESIRLAETIQTEAEKHNVIMPVLIEVNAAQEESKFGLTLDETPAFIEQVSAYPNLKDFRIDDYRLLLSKTLKITGFTFKIYIIYLLTLKEETLIM